MQSEIAAIGGASALAKRSGRNFWKYSVIFGARSSSPAVANTERANPGSRLCQGSMRITAAIAKPSAGIESLCRPDPLANNITAAIAAARKTEGDGRTSEMKAISTTPVSVIRSQSFRITHCESQSRNAETIAKFAPLTAVKCASPLLRIATLKSALCSDVSPRTMPGISAPESSPRESFRKLNRISPSVLLHAEGLLRTLISRASISAATRTSLMLRTCALTSIF